MFGLYAQTWSLVASTIRRRKRAAASAPRPSRSGMRSGSGSRPIQMMLSRARDAFASLARNDMNAHYDTYASTRFTRHKEEGMLRNKRGLGWALAASVLLAACGGGGTGPPGHVRDRRAGGGAAAAGGIDRGRRPD